MPLPASNDFVCEACGDEIHPNSRSCPHCGARREIQAVGNKAAWGQSEHLDGIDLPDPAGDDFDYDDFIGREFGDDANSASASPRDWKKTLWWLTALITLIAFTLLAIRW